MAQKMYDMTSQKCGVIKQYKSGGAVIPMPKMEKKGGKIVKKVAELKKKGGGC